MEKLKDIIFKFLRLDGLIENLSGYVESRIELLKIEIREDVAKAMAKTLIFLVMFFLAFLFLIFLSIGLAHFLNQYLAHSYAGYWIVAAIYGLGFLFFLIFRKSIYANFEHRLSEMIKGQEK